MTVPISLFRSQVGERRERERERVNEKADLGLEFCLLGLNTEEFDSL